MTAGARILVARPDHLGDLLLTLPAIAALKRHAPSVRVTCMVPRGIAAAAERATDIDEVLPAPFEMRDAPPSPDSPEVATGARALRGRADLALLPRPHDPWSGALVARAEIPLRVGHAQPATVPYLTHAFPERHARHVAREAVILALRAAALLGPRTGPPGHRGRDAITLRAEDHAAAAEVLSGHRLLAEDPVVVHAVAGWSLKSWPIERWSRLADAIAARLRRPVILAGQPPDRPLLETVAKRSRGHAVVVDSLDVGGLAALHRRAAAVVGLDSGALHLAALVGAPVVGLFGPFGPGRVRPLAPPARSIALFAALPCSPCGTLEDPPCGARRDPACLTALAPDQVVEAVARLVDSEPAGARMTA